MAAHVPDLAGILPAVQNLTNLAKSFETAVGTGFPNCDDVEGAHASSWEPGQAAGLQIHYRSMPDFVPASYPLGVVPSGLERGHLTQAGLNREATVSRILATATSPAGSSTSTLASRFGQST